MSDSGYDMCECISGHQRAMRQLISYIQQNTAYCTDNECLEQLPGPTRGGDGGITDTYMMGFAMVLMMFAVAMYYFRPSPLRQSDNEKPSSNGDRRDRDFPPPSSPAF